MELKEVAGAPDEAKRDTRQAEERVTLEALDQTLQEEWLTGQAPPVNIAIVEATKPQKVTTELI